MSGASRLFALAAATYLCASGRAEAAGPQQLCRPSAETAFPSSTALQDAAAKIELSIASGLNVPENANTASQLLEVPAATGEPPSSDSRAAYCAAAGEVMRAGPQGSQFQAQTYLLAALRAAQQAKSERIAALAAYRLGIVSQPGATVSGARGARRQSRSASTREVTVQTGEVAARTTDAGACAQLASPAVTEQPNSTITYLSFECAAASGEAAGEGRLSALANLRLARLGVQYMEAAPETASKLRPLAVSKAQEGLAAIKTAGDPAVRAELTGRLASVLLDLGETASPLLREAPALMRSADPSPGSRAFAAALEGRIALKLGKKVQAASLIRQAILLEAQRALPARLPEWYLLLGEAEPERRALHVASAYRALEAVRPLLPRNDPLTDEATFSLHMRQVFESATDVQLASASEKQATAIRAAQEIVEAYRQAELQSVFGSECLPPREPLKPQELRKGEVLLYPLLLPDRVELLYAVGGGDGSYKRLPPNRSANRNAVSRLVEQMVISMSYGDDQDWRAPARTLYDLLIKPIEGELGPGAVLAIIPDGPLRGLPFAALLGEDGRFLIQRSRLTIAPALAYSQPGGTQRDKLSVVAASLQKELDLPVGFFPKLEGTATEARIAAGSAANSRYIQDFRKADLVQAMGGNHIDVLHLATHASFNGRSDRAFIVANGEVIMLSELRNLIAQNRTRGQDLDLLVLSACETAVGDDDASMGLAGAAVQAGATSAIASLWQVNDAGTAELMRQFYDRLRGGVAKSEAIREAQLALLQGGGDNANPNIWAAFTLLGAWR